MMTRVFIAMFFLLALTEGWPRLTDSDCELGRNMHITCKQLDQCGVIEKKDGQLTCKLRCKCKPGKRCLRKENIDWSDITTRIYHCPWP
uniref:Conotoxin superfamily E n=1 Tax=Conus ermineus TaxID=55423 RepID=A0A346CIY4_CONER|nr:conotoxin precursor superfamily E [Conus ermineus]